MHCSRAVAPSKLGLRRFAWAIGGLSKSSPSPTPSFDTARKHADARTFNKASLTRATHTGAIPDHASGVGMAPDKSGLLRFWSITAAQTAMHCSTAVAPSKLGLRRFGWAIGRLSKSSPSPTPSFDTARKHADARTFNKASLTRATHTGAIPDHTSGVGMAPDKSGLPRFGSITEAQTAMHCSRAVAQRGTHRPQPDESNGTRGRLRTSACTFPAVRSRDV
jgi:hypothetical protein